MTDIKPERRSGERIAARVPVSIKTGTIFLYTDSRIVAGSELEMVLILPPEITHGQKQWVCCRASVVRVEDGESGGDFGVAASIRSMEILPEIPS
jgi:hypothetical protein